MKLWTLKRKANGCEKVDGFVIRAKTERAARSLAKACDEQFDWGNDDKASCVELTTDGPCDIIMMDCNTELQTERSEA